MASGKIRIRGLPDSLPAEISSRCQARLRAAVEELLRETGVEDLAILIENDVSENPRGAGTPSRGVVSPVAHRERRGDELSLEERAQQYTSFSPWYDFEFLVVSDEVKESLLSAVDLVRLESKVFDDWNLRKIEPFPRTVLNLHGPPGTGKTLAAHALADYLGSPILVASYAQIESKYHGEGPKNVEALFYAAERDGALLFIDEADSLVSRRLINVTQGSEHAINSMRSQLLVCLERFRGVVVLATNLIESYDPAFETRMRHILFPMPDRRARYLIWQRHLPPELPLDPDVSLERLADIEGVCGRDIKNAVIDAALRVARQGRSALRMDDLLEAIVRIKRERIQPAADAQCNEPAGSSQ